MFKVFKEKFDKLVTSIKLKTLSREELEQYRDDFVIFLVENDVAFEVAEKIFNGFLESVEEHKVNRFSDLDQVLRELFKKYIHDILKSLEPNSLEERIRSSGSRPYKIMFIGVNGVGKTTTLAKVGYRLRKSGFLPLLVCSDTFRAGAIEQLKTHAERLSLPFFSTTYGHDPAAVAYDAISYAESRRYDVVLIDTAGRQYSNVNLMNELSKVSRINNPDEIILVLDSLTGYDAYTQAKEFYEHVGFNYLIFTKVDADVKGGAILTVTYEFRKPIQYLGVGQGYEDLKPFNSDEMIKLMFGG